MPSNAPWTTLNSEFGHPNGPNNGDEQWAIEGGNRTGQGHWPLLGI